MTLKAVFLDAGGTLIREDPPRQAIYAEVARELGASITASAMRERMHAAFAILPRTLGTAYRFSERWFEAFIEEIFGRGLRLGPETVAAARRELFRRFADPGSFRLYPGARELCESVRARGLRLGVISNWSEPLPTILAGLGLAPALEFVLVSSLERCEKPEPEIFRRALARSGVAPAQALHAGNDPELDCRGAEAVGIRGVLVDREGAVPAGTCARVRDLFELDALIAEAAA